MKNKFSYFLLLLACMGCGSLKTVKERISVSRQLEGLQQDSLRLQERIAQALVLQDSSESNSTVFVWPKGAFSYSPSEGFKGTADLMVLQHRQKQARAVTMRHEATRTLKTGKKQQLSTAQVFKQEASSKERKLAGPVVFWVVVGLVSIGAVWWFWRR